jgi:lactoylglutathione lyase
MSVSSLDHINILSRDIPRTTAFLTGVLGLQEGHRPPFGTPGAWLYAGGRAVVHVSSPSAKERTHVGDTSMGAASAEVTMGSVDHVAFRCTGYREMIAKLRSLGIASHEADVPGTGDHQIFVDGPDVTFELIFAAADVAA